MSQARSALPCRRWREPLPLRRRLEQLGGLGGGSLRDSAPRWCPGPAHSSAAALRLRRITLVASDMISITALHADRGHHLEGAGIHEIPHLARWPRCRNSALAVSRPRRSDEWSTTSSCSRVAVWMNSMNAAASWMQAARHAGAAPPRHGPRAARSAGRRRLPPPATICSATGADQRHGAAQALADHSVDRHQVLRHQRPDLIQRHRIRPQGPQNPGRMVAVAGAAGPPPEPPGCRASGCLEGENPDFPVLTGPALGRRMRGLSDWSPSRCTP